MTYFRTVAAIYWAKERLYGVRKLLPAAVRKRVFLHVAERAIKRLPSRRFMEISLVPALAHVGVRRILFVGTRMYTQSLIRAFESTGIAVWSVDSDPANADAGSTRGHFVADVREINRLAAGHRFDAILFNGIVGFGIDTVEDAEKTLAALRAVAAPAGLMILGWNPGLHDETAAVFRDHLTPVSLPDLRSGTEFPAVPPVQPYPHRYELFRIGG